MPTLSAHRLRRPGRSPRTAALVAVVTLALAGCASVTNGIGHGGTPPAAPTAPVGFPSTSTAPTTSIPPPATDGRPATTAQLQAVVIQPSDLPTGWTSKPDTDDGDSAQDQQLSTELDTCLDTRDTGPDIVNSANAPDFLAGGFTLFSSATSYRSDADVESDAGALDQPNAQNCLQTNLQQTMGAEHSATTTFGTVSLVVLAHPAGVPSNVAAVAVASIPVVQNGQPFTLHFGTAFITGPKIEADFTFLGAGVDMQTEFFDQLVTAEANRAAQA
jgi:hypothetical protein